MKIYTSYFYQIRNFPPNLIPLSTAMFDPKYYHNFCGKDHQFFDKRGVYNGARAEPFVPGEECQNLCRGLDNCTSKDPSTCAFLSTYRKQLDRLDFQLIMKRFETLAFEFQAFCGIGDVNFALIVYEKPTALCSERTVIQQWFKDHGYEIEEWHK